SPPALEPASPPALMPPCTVTQAQELVMKPAPPLSKAPPFCPTSPPAMPFCPEVTAPVANELSIVLKLLATSPPAKLIADVDEASPSVMFTCAEESLMLPLLTPTSPPAPVPECVLSLIVTFSTWTLLMLPSFQPASAPTDMMSAPGVTVT